jgi:hypothetical protein
MSNNVYYGEGYVPAYQMSASPWVTSSQVTLGSTVQLNFPQATKFVTVQNTGATNTEIAVGFTQNGLKTANSNFFILSGTNSFSAEIRVDRLFISGAVGATVPYTVIAGLTPIQSKDFLTVTGSSGFSGVG